VVYIRVEAEVRPTEDVGKVLKAISTIVRVDNTKIEDIGKGYRMVVIESTDILSLKPFHDVLRKYRILDTAREYMLKHRQRDTIVIMFNKQAAYQGYANFIDSPNESPLGAIVLTITSTQIDKVIDWLAPRTAHGKPLWEVEPPKDV